MEGGEPRKLTNEASVLTLLYNAGENNANENGASVKKKSHINGMVTKSVQYKPPTSRMRGTIPAQRLVHDNVGGNA